MGCVPAFLLRAVRVFSFLARRLGRPFSSSTDEIQVIVFTQELVFSDSLKQSVFPAANMQMCEIVTRIGMWTPPPRFAPTYAVDGYEVTGL